MDMLMFCCEFLNWYLKSMNDARASGTLWCCGQDGSPAYDNVRIALEPLQVTEGNSA